MDRCEKDENEGEKNLLKNIYPHIYHLDCSLLFSADPNSHLVSFSSAQRRKRACFNISYSESLLPFIDLKRFLFCLHLKKVFAGYRILGWQFILLALKKNNSPLPLGLHGLWWEVRYGYYFYSSLHNMSFFWLVAIYILSLALVSET